MWVESASDITAEQVYPDESPEIKQQIQALCAAKEIDVMLKPYVVINKNGKKRILLSAAGYDIFAHHSGQYLGADAVVFGPDKLFSKKLSGIQIDKNIPEYATQTIYRNTQNGTAHFTATIYADEYLNDISHVKNCHMFMAKWVHCVVMRQAFADVIGSQVAADELDANMDFSKGSLGKVELQSLPEGLSLPIVNPAEAAKMAKIQISQQPSAKEDVKQLIAEVFG